METTKRTYTSLERGRGCEEFDAYEYVRTETFDFVAQAVTGSLIGYSGSERVNEKWSETFAERNWTFKGDLAALDAARKASGWAVVK